VFGSSRRQFESDRAKRVGWNRTKYSLKSVTPLPAIDPPVLKVPLSLTPPSLADYVSDLDRVPHALRNLDMGRVTIGLPTLKKISRVLRDNQWNVNVTLMDLWDRKEISISALLRITT